MSSIDVKLNVFEGPLDLLLHLIEKNKFNIFDIPIVEITNQYLEYLDAMEEEDLDVMSEFLLMAATLISIKAKMLLPKDEEESEEEEDPRDELVRKLLEYKMYKYASFELKDMQIDAEKSYYKQPTIPQEIKEYKEEINTDEVLSGVTLSQLNEIFNQIMKRQVNKIDPVRSKFGTITKEEIKIEDKMLEIREKIRGLKGINFKTLLDAKRGKMNVIVSFLAILELMKTGDITIRQDKIFGDIVIDSLE